jgi:hypothetical protein
MTDLIIVAIVIGIALWSAIWWLFHIVWFTAAGETVSQVCCLWVHGSLGLVLEDRASCNSSHMHFLDIRMKSKAFGGTMA